MSKRFDQIVVLFGDNLGAEGSDRENRPSVASTWAATLFQASNS